MTVAASAWDRSIHDTTAFGKALKEAGIENFRFHDFRHIAITNWRRQGHDYFKIMAASGHKTMSAFKRYNTVSEENLKSLVAVSPSSSENSMDTNMDTKHDSESSEEKQKAPK